jgi:hypothetical protein
VPDEDQGGYLFPNIQLRAANHGDKICPVKRQRRGEDIGANCHPRKAQYDTNRTIQTH